MNPMLIAEKLTDIDDRYILESDPVTGVILKNRPHARPLSRFLNSGLGAAVISGAVALGVLIFVVLAGRVSPETPPVTPLDSTDLPPAMETDTDSEAVTEPETETEENTQEETEAITEDTVIDTPEEAEARKDELIAILDGLDYKWNILNDPSYYFDQYTPVKAFGVYGVPYMLDYIMEHEGETDAEELKRLGVILHFAYHNLGITDTSEWYRKENHFSQDVFVNLQALMQHLQKNGLPSPEELSKTKTPSTEDAPTENTTSNLSKEDVYKKLNEFNFEYFYSDWYPTASSISDKELHNAFAVISSLGVETIPYILEYIINSQDIYNAVALSPNLDYALWGEYRDRCFLLSAAYHMLGVDGHYSIHWISPDGYVQGRDSFVLLSQYLLDHIEKNGLRPIYPFISAEEAAANQDRITRQLEDTSSDFKWYLSHDLTDYQFDASLVTVFGPYAVPYILDYILSHEGQPLTPDEELNLGVLLHLSYRMLGVESTAAWHMPAEPVEFTTDPFPYARELAAHLSEYGLEAVS